MTVERLKTKLRDACPAWVPGWLLVPIGLVLLLSVPSSLALGAVVEPLVQVVATDGDGQPVEESSVSGERPATEARAGRVPVARPHPGPRRLNGSSTGRSGEQPARASVLPRSALPLLN